MLIRTFRMFWLPMPFKVGELWTIMCANIRRVGERHKIIRQTDFGFGVDARTDSGSPLRPDPPLPVRSLPHDLCHGWDLQWWLPAPSLYYHHRNLLYTFPGNFSSLGLLECVGFPCLSRLGSCEQSCVLIARVWINLSGNIECQQRG